MLNSKRSAWLWIVSLLAVMVLACNLTSTIRSNQPAGESTAAPSQSAGSAKPAQGTTGPGASSASGSFNLDSAAVGLDRLDAYRATLKVSFEGTESGEASQWSQTYTLSVSRPEQVRLLSVQASGLPEDQSTDGWLRGEAEGVVYFRPGQAASCSADFRAADNTPQVLEIAQMLPPLQGAADTGNDETLAGITVRHYRFDEKALGLEGDAKAAGEVWVAIEGGYVVKYTFSLDDRQGVMDPDMKGVLTKEYTLEDIGQPQITSLPQDCPPSLGEAPALPDAATQDRLPNYLAYTTTSAVKDVVAFYQEKLPAAGYQAVGDVDPESQSVVMEYTQGGRTLSVLIDSTDPTRVQLLLENGKPEVIEIADPTAEPAAAAAADASQRISKALSLVLGDSKTPSVFASYRLEFNETKPVAAKDSGQIANETYQLKTDVQGANVHLTGTSTPAGKDSTTEEGYLIDGKNYQVSNGQVTETASGIEMTWAMWPIDVLSPLGLASLGAEKQGSETIDGREADVFALDTAKASPSDMDLYRQMIPFGPTIVSAKGKIWLDRETGGLLKLSLDYEAEVKDAASGKVIGNGPGHAEIAVTNVGKVEVKLP